jgi:2-polyprenyl-6-methoxyphenol hydroxylase-like FAD-dependent oxidoreductase
VALTLNTLKIPNVLVESGRLDGRKVGESLHPNIKPVLQDLKLLDVVAGCNAHLPSHGYSSCWNSDEVEFQDFLFSPYGYGWHLDRKQFDADLLDLSVSTGTTHERLFVTQITPTTQEGEKEATWKVTCSQKDGKKRTEIYCKWVIDASGRNRVVTKQLGISPIRKDKLLSFSVIITNPAVSGHSMVEAVATGWWYTTNLPGDQQLITFYTDDDLPSSKLARTAKGFKELLGATKLAKVKKLEVSEFQEAY